MIERMLLVAAVVVLAAVAGRWWQARQGRVVATTPPGSALDRPGGGGADVVATATLFTTPTCRTCPQVRANLAEVAAEHPGLRVVEVDAAADLAQAHHHRVRRAPTVVFSTAGGTEVARASGLVTVPAIRGVLRGGEERATPAPADPSDPTAPVGTP